MSVAVDAVAADVVLVSGAWMAEAACAPVSVVGTAACVPAWHAAWLPSPASHRRGRRRRPSRRSAFAVGLRLGGLRMRGRSRAPGLRGVRLARVLADIGDVALALRGRDGLERSFWRALVARR